MSEAPRLKTVPLRIKSNGTPDEGQLAKIRRFTLADIGAEQLYTRQFVVAHNAIDRDNECFGDDVLTAFATTLPGKGLHIRHPTGWDGDTGPGEGRWYDAQVVRMSHDEARELLGEPAMKWPPDHKDAALLMGYAYMARTTSNGDLLVKVDAGIAGSVSLGFNAKWPERVLDEDGHELTVRRWGMPAEALEASLVWLGAQPGARAVKHASRHPQDPANEDSSVDVNQKLQAAEAKNGELEQQLATLTPKAAKFDALGKAVGAEEIALLDQPDAFGETVKAAKAYRDDLIDTIVAGERAQGLVGDSDDEVKAAREIYAGHKTERLQALAKHYAARTPTGGRMSPSDPNAGRESGAKGAFHDNPALGGRVVATA